MSNPAIDIASAIQSASIKPNPSPAHDLNPSTAASTKRPVSPTASLSSRADSIPESALKPLPRRANLPPLPDLRFEQSYLASLKDVESKWAIAWITARDQVCGPATTTSSPRLTMIKGSASVGAGHVMDAGTFGMEILEQDRRISRCESRESGAQMVVERQQLEDTRSEAW